MTLPSHFLWFPAPCLYLTVTAGLWVSVPRALIGPDGPGAGIPQCAAGLFPLPMRADWPSNSLFPEHFCALCFGAAISPARGLIYHQLHCTPQCLPEHCLSSRGDSELCANTATVTSAATFLYPELRQHKEADAVSHLWRCHLPEEMADAKNNLSFQRGRGVTAVSQHQGWVSADSWALAQFPLLPL